MKAPQTQLTEDDVGKVLALLKDSDSVELKLTVPESDHRSAMMALGMDVLDAEIRQVVFFDTPSLRLNRAGLVVRARRIRQGGDSVIKIRPIVPAEVSRKVRKSVGFTVEVDAMPGAFVCSGSLKARVSNSDVNRVLSAKEPVRQLFSAEQRAFYAKHAPKRLGLDRLTPLGPINVAKLKFMPGTFNRSLTVEVWFYPDGSRILELSTKCPPNETFHAVAETRAFLRAHGISLNGGQNTKTSKALQYFSRVHREKAA